eukprot:COSAG04_NODE_2926_length_3377_cov_6.370958_2_plen_228_part_00
MCDAPGGRVVAVFLGGTGVGGELLPFFGRLGALQFLVLGLNPALRGDVADLAGATELLYLNLQDCPLVVGEAAALAALVHLGEECSVCSPFVPGLTLAGSGVHGPVAALRALPGLGADWDDFSPCSAFGGQQASIDNNYTWGTGSPGCGAAGLAPVPVSPPTPQPRFSPSAAMPYGALYHSQPRRTFCWHRTRRTWQESTSALAVGLTPRADTTRAAPAFRQLTTPC